MDKTEFLHILTKNNIDVNLISFEDSTRDDAFCIRKYYGIWEVYYRERGKEFDPKKFQSESEVLLYLLKKLGIMNTGDSSSW